MSRTLKAPAAVLSTVTFALVLSSLQAEAQTLRPPGTIPQRPGQPLVIAPQSIPAQAPQPAPAVQPQTAKPSTTAKPAPAPAVPAPTGGVAAHVHHRLQNVNEIVLDGARNLKVDAKKLRALYSQRAWEPIFITMQGRTPLAETIVGIFQQQAPLRGLDTEYYLTPVITNRWLATDQEGLLTLEFALAGSLIQYVSDLSVGRIDLGDETNLPDIKLFQCKNGKTPVKCEFSNFPALNEMLASPQALANGIHQFEPMDARYRDLMNVMARLLQVKKAGDWPKFGKLRKIEPKRGERDASMPLLRQRLVDIGLITADEIRQYYAGNLNSLDYDEFLQHKVMALQDNNELTYDKVIGPKTWAVINKPVQSFIDQVKANLERWRLLPRSLGDRYIIVNLGLQWLQLFDQGKLALPMKVVIGQESRRTPSLIDAVHGVKFRPSWSAPDSIAAKDLIPKIQQNPNYLEEGRYIVLENWSRKLTPEEIQRIPWSLYPPAELAKRYKIRQLPGENSALGVIKFELSNGDDIYLHDTNHREGFAAKTRFASSGCIRLEKPLELAEYLLREEKVSRNDDGDLLKAAAGQPKPPQRNDNWGWGSWHRPQQPQSLPPVPAESFRFDLSTLQNITSDEQILDRRFKLAKPFRVYIVAFTADSGEDRVVNLTSGVYQQDERIVAAMNGFRFTAQELEDFRRKREEQRLGTAQAPGASIIQDEPGFGPSVRRPGQPLPPPGRRQQQPQHDFNIFRVFQW